MLFRSASSCASAHCHRGTYEGDEAPRLATLKYAALLGAPFIDVEYKAAATFFASECDGTTNTLQYSSSSNWTMRCTLQQWAARRL